MNPIGSISKEDLRQFIRYAANHLFEPSFGHLTQHANRLRSVLQAILEAPPTAELTPLAPDGTVQQTDETEMGLTYAQMSRFGRLRKQERCGPVAMVKRLLDDDSGDDRATPQELGDQVKRFFRRYSVNRHKTTILPPAYHMESYSADDNR